MARQLRARVPSSRVLAAGQNLILQSLQGILKGSQRLSLICSYALQGRV